MPIAHPDQIKEFLTSIGPLEAVYAQRIFSFAGKKTESGWRLLTGKLDLTGIPAKTNENPLEVDDIILGQYDLNLINITVEQFIAAITTGGLQLPCGLLQFHKSEFPSLPATYQKFLETGPGERLDTLTLLGGHPRFPIGPELDWQFRNATVPYDGIAEALFEYGLGGQLFTGHLSINAQQVLAIDAESIVVDRKAAVKLRLSKKASAEKVSFGYRAILPGPKVAQRGRIAGSDFAWEETPAFRVGCFELDVPEGAIVHGFAAYDQCGQQRYFIGNPNASHNPARAAFEVFDPGLSNLKTYLEGEGKKQNDFEVGVCNLLGLLGFSVTPLGGPKHKDAPDNIARVPSTGDLALVECTLDTLKGDNKLGKLVKRVVEVRTRLALGGVGHFKVLPVIVSALPMDQLAGDLPEAKRLGIAVVDRNMLLDGLQRTVLQGDPKKIFDDAWQSVEEGKKEAQT